MYNEGRIARLSIETILAYTKKLPPVVTVLVVNDGSRDATTDILESLAGKYKKDEFQVVSHLKNKGYGAALKTGVDFAICNSYDYVIFMDSDLTNHPKYLAAFYDKILDGCDYIKAARYVKGGGTRGVPWKRRFISRCGNIFARFVTGLPLTDITNGFRAVKVDILKQFTLTENHFAVIIEELMKARKFTSSFCEIPYILETRSKEAGATKFSYDFITFLKYTKRLFL